MIGAAKEVTWGEGLDLAQVAGVLKRFSRVHLSAVLPADTARRLRAGAAPLDHRLDPIRQAPDLTRL